MTKVFIHDHATRVNKMTKHYRPSDCCSTCTHYSMLLQDELGECSQFRKEVSAVMICDLFLHKKKERRKQGQPNQINQQPA